MTAQVGTLNGREIYQRLLAYVWPYRGVFLVSVIGMIAVAAAETSFAALLKPIMDGGFVDKNQAMIRLTPVLLVVVFLIRAFGSFADQYCISWVARKVVFDLRAQMFDRMIRFPTSYFDQEPTSGLVSKLLYDVEQVAQASAVGLRICVKDSVLCIALLGWMTFLSWELTLVFLVLTPVAALIVRKASLRFRKTSEGIQNSMASITKVATEAFQGQRIVKAFSGYSHENRSFETANVANRNQTMRKALVASASVPLLIFLAGTTVALMIYLAMSGVLEAFVSPGTFVSYMGAILLLMGPIKRLARVNEYLQTGIAAANSVFRILDEAVEDADGHNPVDPFKSDLELKNVSFRYAEDKPLALDNLSIKIAQGETVALVGASGSGKSSIIALLLGLYPLQSGEILIDGKPISECSREWLRGQFGLAPQEALLFDGSIKENITYGQIEVDQKVLAGVIETTQIDSITNTLPAGLDWVVGEQGVRLSGGQRQRLSIARALYRQAPILILDEATSALDTESEALIREAIKAKGSHQTVLIIAHRLSTIVDSDIILVMQEGRLVESGTHSELMGLQGRYFDLHRAQETAREISAIDPDR